MDYALQVSEAGLYRSNRVGLSIYTIPSFRKLLLTILSAGKSIGSYLVLYFLVYLVLYVGFIRHKSN